ncbi:hypothetical protein ST37_07155 [Vibrio sp. qd031]|nr:hypothetical protein ST37_07155 [Vibrio sp. qd031]
MKQNWIKHVLSASVIAALSSGVALAQVVTPAPASVTSSEHDGNGPERALDGDFKTRWSANGEGSWMVFDYTKPTTFSAVKVALHKGDERTTSFGIAVSDDGENWTTVIEKVTSSGTTLGLERFDFEPVTAKYIKFTGFGNSSSAWNSVTEFIGVNCAIDSCDPSEIPPQPILVPVAVESSEHDGNGPDRLIDNDVKTRWSANGDGSWAILDYGDVYPFDAVRAAFHKGDERATSFDIEVSVDGNTWTPVLTGAKSSGGVTSFERFEFDTVDARYIKYIGHGNSSNTWNSVTELAALNCEINQCPVEHIITEEVLAAAKLAADKKKYQIKHLGKATTLDDWKITLPITYKAHFGDNVEKDGAAEILPSECSLDGSSFNADVKNPYFWVDNKGWHFKTPLEGGATTPNATYIRTELRELGNGWKPCDSMSGANWAHGGTHTLTATLTLDQIPETPLKKDGKSKSDPKVVLGQIHAKDISAATVKLLWEGKEKPVRVILNKNTEKSAFSVKLGKIDDPSKPWSYMIRMTDDGIVLKAGGVEKSLKFGEELDNVWKDETFYFKAGLYPQIYKNSGGAFEATFSKLSIEHTKRDGDFGVHVPLICNPEVSDCSCVEQDPNCQWWEVPLPSPTIPAKPVAGNTPGENFDLTGWYVSLPFDHDKNGKPDDVFEWHLAQGYEHPELFYTGEDGGLVMKSYIKGVRTSQNTKYVRTELREMNRRGDRSVELKGVNKNNWVFSSAPIEDQKAAAGVDGVLEATLKIDHTTTTGEPNQVGRFIIGQIHDQDDEPVRLYYRKLPDRDTGTVYFAHENTREGSDTFYELVGSMNGITDDGIALGEVFSYRIEVVGNTLTVTVMRDGKPDAVQVVDMSESGYDVGGKYMYFKAGVYNQNNSGDPDDYAQVTFYKLEKSHGSYQE